jgi:parvulin-like peptidyl-prolyl isomerase
MKTSILTSIITFISLVSVGQQTKSSFNPLAAVNSVNKAKQFIESNPKLHGRLFIIAPGVDTADLLEPLYLKKLGYTFKLAEYSHKIVGIDSARSLKVSYIYLDGEKLSKPEIDSMRDKIISQYKDGISFDQLAQTYTMDGNTTGSLGWIREEYVAAEFVDAVKSHKRGEIFTADIPSHKWYYVVLKTYDESYIKILTILRIKSSS